MSASAILPDDSRLLQRIGCSLAVSCSSLGRLRRRLVSLCRPLVSPCRPRPWPHQPQSRRRSPPCWLPLLPLLRLFLFLLPLLTAAWAFVWQRPLLCLAAFAASLAAASASCASSSASFSAFSASATVATNTPHLSMHTHTSVAARRASSSIATRHTSPLHITLHTLTPRTPSPACPPPVHCSTHPWTSPLQEKSNQA